MANDQVREDVKAVLEYLWDDERKHYICVPSKDHIYLVLRRLAKAISHESLLKDPYFVRKRCFSGKPSKEEDLTIYKDSRIQRVL